MFYMVGDQRLCDACHYLGEKMVLRQAQFAANEAVRSTRLASRCSRWSAVRCTRSFLPSGKLLHHDPVALARSICIGETGFLGPETNGPKSPSGQKRSPRRPKRSRNSPPMAGSLAVSGKTAGSKDCVVDLVGLELSTRPL